MYPVERLAENDGELAQVFYWRAVMLEAQDEELPGFKRLAETA